MNRFLSYFESIGGCLMIAGLVLKFIDVVYAPYIYLLGSILFAYSLFVVRYQGRNVVLRRLMRQQLSGLAMLILTGVVMILFHRNEWIVLLTIGTFNYVYTVFRIPNELKKENKK